MDNNDSGGSTKTACNQGGDMETDSNAIDRYRSRSRPPWVSGQTWPPQGQGEESSRGSVPGSLCNILLQLQGASISLLYCDLGDTDHIIITDPSLCSDICLQAFCDHSNILISFLLSRTQSRNDRDDCRHITRPLITYFYLFQINHRCSLAHVFVTNCFLKTSFSCGDFLSAVLLQLGSSRIGVQ